MAIFSRRNILLAGGLLAAGALGGCVNMNSAAPTIAPVMESISVPGGRSMGPYSQAMRAGDYVFLSGIIALNSKTGKFAEAKIGPQTQQVFANLKDVLAAAGLGLDDVVKTTVFLDNPKDFASMNTIYGEYFKDHKPARSTMPGMDWGRPDLLIEMDAIAYAPRR